MERGAWTPPSVAVPGARYMPASPEPSAPAADWEKAKGMWAAWSEEE